MTNTIIFHLAAEANAINNQIQALEDEPVQMAADGPGKHTRGRGMTWLRVNQIINRKAAYEIMGILKHDD